MMLGTDVSSLSTTAANAAVRGLSIVVPLYNEAAGLAALHARLGGTEGGFEIDRWRSPDLTSELASDPSEGAA